MVTWLSDVVAHIASIYRGGRGVRGRIDRRGQPWHGRRGGIEQLEDRHLLTAVVAEHVFYNDSSFNGNTVAASTQDDNAIAPNTLPAGYVPRITGDTAVLGAVPMGNISNVTVVNDGNYNSFPGITSLPNGELIVVYRCGADHVSMGATINYTVSKDGGKTWSAPQVLATPPAELGVSRRRDCHAFQWQRDGLVFPVQRCHTTTRTRSLFPGRTIPRPAR